MQSLLNSWTPPESLNSRGIPLTAPTFGVGSERPPAVPLVYADVYRSELWRRTSPIDRVPLLLVAEGYKLAWLDARRLPSSALLHQLGLTRSGRYVHRAADVAFAAAVSDSAVRCRTSHDVIVSQGSLLGYPRCCAGWFADQSRRAHAEAPSVIIDELPTNQFRARLADLQRRDGVIPIELIYVSKLGFIPCHPDCLPARRLLRTWHTVLTAADPAAVRYFHDEFRRMLRPSTRVSADPTRPVLARPRIVGSYA